MKNLSANLEQAPCPVPELTRKSVHTFLQQAMVRLVTGLEDLPVELIYEIQLFSLSEQLPCTSRRLYEIFGATTATFRADYLLERLKGVKNLSNKFTKVLCYPICNEEVLQKFCQHHAHCGFVRCELPKRLFRSLAPPPAHKLNFAWKDHDEPLPFLRFLFDSPGPICRPVIDSHQGYALTKAVHARHIPLVKFLLEHGASPGWKQGLAVQVAIRQKDLVLVKLLIEREETAYEPGEGGKKKKLRGKRRRMSDRVEVNKEMLRAAIKCDARDIVQYFSEEKGCVPDMQTLRMMK